MHDESSIFARERRELITRRLPTFAFGWMGTLGIWLAVFAVEGRLVVSAVALAAMSFVALRAMLAVTRADPAAPRVLRLVLATCVGLGFLGIELVRAVAAYGEILAFLLLTLYLMAALLFAWGWRAEITLMAATLVLWIARFDGFQLFVPLPELVAAIAIGAGLALGVAEASKRNVRQVFHRRRAQQEATAALQASRDAYRDLAEKAPDLIWSADRDGRITYVNESQARFLGLPAEQIVGRHYLDFQTSHPENPDVVAVFESVVAGAPLSPTLIQYPTPRGARWVEVIATPVIDEHGYITGVRGISRDVHDRKAAEDALRASEARYRGLVQSQHELVVRMDFAGRFTFVNDAYAATFAQPQSALLGQSFLALVHPDDHGRITTAMAAMAEPPHRTFIEIRNLTAAGVRWIAWEGGVVVDANGRMVEAQAVGRDVTERRVSEDALRASEARYRGLVESQLELVTRFDRDGNLTFANDSYCRAIGYPRDTIVGKNPMFLVHPDDREQVMASFQAVTRPPYRARRESRGLTPFGWRWFEWELSGVRDADDHVVEVQQVGRDVTARRQAEANLRESEERFRSAFDDAAIGMALTTIDGRTIRVNPALCVMLGYTEAELLARSPKDVVHPEDLTTLAADRERLGDGGSPFYRAERRYLHRDGHVLWVHVTASLVKDVNGAPLYFLGQIQDITERHLAEEALRESIVELRRSEERLRLLAQRQALIREEERKRVGFDLHDDVCQELVGVGILVESLRRKLAPMPAEHAAEFERVVRYLGEVVEHLRLLARELRPLLLRDLGLDGSLRSLADGMSSATLSVVTEFAAQVPRLDEEAEVTVYRIAQEALANAVRHAGASEIVIALAAADGMLRLEVRDDGCGFDPSVRPAVALGLASMEERALALGGRLEIRSHVGRGTTVALVCPLAVRELGDPSPTRSSSLPSTATTPRSAARD